MLRSLLAIAIVAVLASAPAHATTIGAGQNSGLDLDDAVMAYDPVHDQYLIAGHQDVGTGSLRAEIFAAIVNADGQPVTGAQRVSFSGPDDASNIYAEGTRAAWDPNAGAFIVTWVLYQQDSNATTVPETRARILNPGTATPATAELVVSAAPNGGPARVVARGGGNPAIVAHFLQGDAKARTISPAGELGTPVSAGPGLPVAWHPAPGAWVSNRAKDTVPTEGLLAFSSESFGAPPSPYASQPTQYTDVAGRGATSWSGSDPAVDPLSRRVGIAWTEQSSGQQPAVRARTIGPDGSLSEPALLDAAACNCRGLTIQNIRDGRGFLAAWTQLDGMAARVATFDANGGAVTLLSAGAPQRYNDVALAAGGPGRALVAGFTGATLFTHTISDLPIFPAPVEPPVTPPASVVTPSAPAKPAGITKPFKVRSGVARGSRGKLQNVLVIVERLTRGSRVTITCQRGCTRRGRRASTLVKRRTARGRSMKVLLKRFNVRNRARITVTVQSKTLLARWASYSLPFSGIRLRAKGCVVDSRRTSCPS